MKVAFVEQSALEESLVVCQASAILKSEGHDTFVLFTKDDFHSNARKINPDVFVVHADIFDYRWARNITLEIRKNFPKSPIIIFGSLPTFDQNPNFPYDFGIIGSAEIPLLFIINLIEGKASQNELVNTFWKNGEKVLISPLKYIEVDMDSLPLPDRDIYYRYSYIANFKTRKFEASRGCILKCKFCYISSLKSMFGRMRILRKSPQRIGEEIENVIRRWKTNFIYFVDDLFPWDKKWLQEFSYIFRDFKIPFKINTLANFVNDFFTELLHQAGCYSVAIGVETHNDEMRRWELDKSTVSNDVLKDAIKNLKKFGIKIETYNIIGLPGESLEDYLRTIDINISLGIDFAKATVLLNIPGATLNGYTNYKKYDHSKPWEYIEDEMKRKEVELTFKLFELSSKFKFVRHILEFLGKNKIYFLNPLLSIPYALYQLKSFKEIYKINLLDGFVYFLHTGLPESRKSNLPALG